MRRRTYILAGLVLFGLFLLPAASYADCSCAPSGGSILQGVEYVAKSCPTEGEDNSTGRIYVSQWIQCTNGTLTRNTLFPASEGMLSVNQIISTANSYNNTKILRNESGSHIIAVHRYYQGKVAGITPPVGITTHDNLNQYCTHSGNLPDADQDGFPYCHDCDDNDPEQNLNCISCQDEYQAKIEECKGEWLLLSFDFSTCEGECVNANNGPPICPL
jgi:hypothetical protein